MSSTVHWRVRGTGLYACGIGRRWSSQLISSSAGRAVVTCGGCKRTRAYAAGGDDADV